MYNYIKSIFGFDVAKGVTSNRNRFDKLSWKTVYWNIKKQKFVLVS